MPNLSKKRKQQRGVSRSAVVMLTMVLLFTGAIAVYLGHKTGVEEGRQQMQSAVERTNARTNELMDQVKGLEKRVKELTPPPGPDSKVPPPHDGLFYATQLKDKVQAAKTPEDKEKVYWSTVCTTQRELIGAPIAVFDGVRADTYRNFIQNIDPYYFKLVVDKDVSFNTDSRIELYMHTLEKMREMEVKPCP